ncbi:hypothetical protein DL771_000773 [Monosporascus sp. 5C6A]|nr:hypothetical protein DL771_000773 [Monosporascus sp. 5C6A]
MEARSLPPRCRRPAEAAAHVRRGAVDVREPRDPLLGCVPALHPHPEPAAGLATRARGREGAMEEHDEELPVLDDSTKVDRQWLMNFFGRNAMFLLGVDGARVDTELSPAVKVNGHEPKVPVAVLNGDAIPGVTKFHILAFASDLRSPVRKRIAQLSSEWFAPRGFFSRLGGHERFNVVLIVKALLHEADELLEGPELENLRNVVTGVYDDGRSDEDAHFWYGVNHARGAVVVVRPDLAVGTSASPEDTAAIDEYLSRFLVHPVASNGNGDGHMNGSGKINSTCK